ncbi:MAG: MFS transporter [Clostridia bacterium]|nr:MFS transporter [Clostridia bacterium]NLV35002.1 MFS transporter [Clostridiaceae bacterium]HQO69084.1 MFS transporter [Clostridia bacterium]
MEHKLWTKDFTILTIGSAVSMLGNAVSGFALGLLILDYTNSTFLYSLTLVIYTLPRIVMPLLAGPYLDRFSRKRIIYTLDFISAALYLLIFGLLVSGFFNYMLILVLALIIGSIDGTYIVAFDSFFPNVVEKQNFSKAYSISSILYPLSAVMVPVAAYFYENYSLAPLFAFNAVTFLIAAIFETNIKAEEKHINSEVTKTFDFSRYKDDFKTGIQYLKQEPGLAAITAYFVIMAFSDSSYGTLVLPYFKNNETFGVMTYTYVMAFAVLGRLIGGVLQYRFKYPPKRRFTIAIFVYTTIGILSGVFLFSPIILMMIMNFLVGIFGVTSYNIRISSTQNYLPDGIRARFNGIFQMLTMMGAIIGQLLAGGLGDLFDERYIVAGFNLINLIMLAVIMIPYGKHVKKIYNTEL